MVNRNSASRRHGMIRNIMHLGLGQAATTILTILLNASMARTLSSSDFGLLYLLTSIATFAYVIVDWGHGQHIIRVTARHPERSGDLLGSATAVRAAGAVVASAVAPATAWLLGYDTRTCLLTGALILAWLPQYLGLSFGWVFRAVERMDQDAVINVVLKVATLVGSVICLASGGRLPGLVLAWSLAGSLTLVLAISIYRRLEMPALTASLSTVRELLRDGASLLVLALAVAIEPYINANILFKMSSPAVVGWYGAAWTIAGTLIAPATILTASMYPRLAMGVGDPAQFKRAFDISFRPLYLLSVLGAVGTYLFADVPIALIYSLPKFAPSADNLRAFAPVLLFMYVDLFLSSALVAAGKATRLASAKVVSVIVMTGLALFLVPLCQARFGNGGLGVMYATIIAELMMLGTAAYLIREVFDARTIATVCLGLLAGAVTILLIRPLSAITPFVTIPLCVLLFGGLSLLLGVIKRSELATVLASFRKPSPAPQ